jgi:putative flippase GtrA
MSFKIPKFVRFVIIGIINTIIDLGVLNILIVLFGLAHPFLFTIYKSISFCCAIVNSYILNKHYTFEVKEYKHKDMLLFFLSSLITFLINISLSSILFYILVNLDNPFNTNMIASISAVFGAVSGLGLNFISYKYIVFK